MNVRLVQMRRWTARTVVGLVHRPARIAVRVVRFRRQYVDRPDVVIIDRDALGASDRLLWRLRKRWPTVGSSFRAPRGTLRLRGCLTAAPTTPCCTTHQSAPRALPRSSDAHAP